MWDFKVMYFISYLRWLLLQMSVWIWLQKIVSLTFLSLLCILFLSN